MSAGMVSSLLIASSITLAVNASATSPVTTVAIRAWSLGRTMVDVGAPLRSTSLRATTIASSNWLAYSASIAMAVFGCANIPNA